MDTIAELKREIDQLRCLLRAKEAQLAELVVKKGEQSSASGVLSKEEIVRYSRQMLIPNFGKKGQSVLKNSSVLVVGVGGLGCPAAQYLVGAGIGCIGLIDYDAVELTNLHRQLLHTEDQIGSAKVISAKQALLRQNSNIKIKEHHTQLDSSNALDIIDQYDVVVDATDNVPTRYLLNDACVMKKKPLVSGSALRMEGQLTVYNYDGGPCYRCLFPQPPPPETVTSCGDGGVLGVVPGTIGVLQALESIKILLKMPGVLKQRLLLFDADSTTFRCISLRPSQKDCAVCGENAKIINLIDYEQFCCAKASDKDSSINYLEAKERIDPTDLCSLLQKRNDSKRFILVDVRSREEFDMCSIPGAINIPWNELTSTRDGGKIKRDAISELKQRICDLPTSESDNRREVFFICRRGNDSQRAVRFLERQLTDLSAPIKLQDVRGGLHAWAKTVDNGFPVY